MPLLATLALDLGLAVVLLGSLFIARGFGELCGIRPGRDKSGLGGFAVLYLFFALRWAGLAVALWATAPTGQGLWLLAAHAGLGAVSLRTFGHGIARVQADRVAPAWQGLLAGVLLPAPALAVAIARSNPALGGDGLLPLAAIGGSVVLLHGLGFRACYLDMRRPAAH